MTTDEPRRETALALEPGAALARIDELLARRSPWTSQAIASLAPALPAVPGRVASVARRLRETTIPESLGLLLELSPDVAGVVEGAHHLFGCGVARRYPTGRRASLGLSLELWPSRARASEVLCQRAADAFGPGLRALQVGGHRVLRGTVAGGDRRLSQVGADLEWLVTNAQRLRKTVVWLDGWRFDAKSLHGPSVAVHYVRRVLDRMRRAP